MSVRDYDFLVGSNVQGGGGYTDQEGVEDCGFYVVGVVLGVWGFYDWDN